MAASKMEDIAMTVVNIGEKALPEEVPEGFVENIATNPNIENLKEILKDVPINFICNNKESLDELNPLQYLCTLIVDKREKDFNKYTNEYRDFYVECFKFILQKNINLSYKEPYCNTDTIDFTVLTGEIGLVKMIIDKYREEKIPVENIDLITSIIHFHRYVGEMGQDYLAIIKLILDEGVDNNTLDFHSGEPPIYLAASLNFKEVIRVLCQNRLEEIDFDNFVDSRGKTARDLIVQHTLYSNTLPKKGTCRFYCLYQYIKDRNATEFIENYKKEDMSDEKRHSFLIRAVQLGANEIAEYLLNETRSTFNDHISLYQIACMKGFYKVIEVLLKYTKPCYDFKLVRLLVKIEEDIENQTEYVDYNKCLSLILSKKPEIDLNKYDKFNKTLLQYAIRMKHSKMISILLTNGASLITRYGKDPEQCLVLDIDPHILKTHFDNCITHKQNIPEKTWKMKRILEMINGEKSLPSQDKYDYKINFASILFPRKQCHSKDEESETHAEMTVLKQIASNIDYNPLLRHPLAAAFISMKSHGISCFFYFDMVLYLLLTSLLTSYILYKYMPLLVLNILLYIITVVWECIQLFIFRRKYFEQGYSLFNITMLAATAILFVTKIPVLQISESFLVQLNSIVVLIALINVFFVLGHFSKFSTSVNMIKTVYTTLFKASAPYAILILAFSISFQLLFEKNNGDYFSTFLQSIFTTFMMSNGEYNTAELDLETHSYASYCVLGLFVFIISIGLFNFLTALAVSDITMIKQDAQIYNQVLRVHQIDRIEKIFLKLEMFQWLKCCCSIKSICLFAKSSEVKILSKKVTFMGYDKPKNVKMSDNIFSLIETRKKYYRQEMELD